MHFMISCVKRLTYVTCIMLFVFQSGECLVCSLKLCEQISTSNQGLLLFECGKLVDVAEFCYLRHTAWWLYSCKASFRGDNKSSFWQIILGYSLTLQLSLSNHKLERPPTSYSEGCHVTSNKRTFWFSGHVFHKHCVPEAACVLCFHQNLTTLGTKVLWAHKTAKTNKIQFSEDS